MKKLAVFMIITTLPVLIFAALVSAGDKDWRNFHGVYAMTAKSNALISTCGFDNLETEVGTRYIPNTGDGCTAWGTAEVAYGIWKFYPNGKGNAKGDNFAYDLPPGHASARNNTFDFDFDYVIKRGGVIEVRVTSPYPLRTLYLTGRVSQDYKTMTLNNTYTFFEDNPNVVFMASRVLIWIQDNSKED